MSSTSSSGADTVHTLEMDTQEACVHAPSLLESQPPHPSTGSLFKRLLDIAGGIIGLVILAVLFMPIAIAIRLDSPGPIFFAQERCGYRGRRFKMYKFRTMVRDADKLRHLVSNEVQGPIFKNRQDPRVTRVGRFLRRVSLDEFPQFWNVLRGEMSLVGTRPPVPEEVASYEPEHWIRLNVKPGLTGEWQVNGRSSISNFDEILALDLRYQELWSLKRDIVIIFKTLIMIFGRSTAF